MRSKHPSPAAAGASPMDPNSLYTAGSDDDPIILSSLAKTQDLRNKNDAAVISSPRAKSKSRCAAARDSSRSGGTTPRRASHSPSNSATSLKDLEKFYPATKGMEKCDKVFPARGDIETEETPRTYLIKGSFLEPDLSPGKSLEQILGVNSAAGKSGCSDRPSPKNVISCASPIASANKFISEIEEVEWFLDGDGGGSAATAAAALPADREEKFVDETNSIARREIEEQDREQDRKDQDGVLSTMEDRELRKKKGKALQMSDRVAEKERGRERRRKAPIAFPTAEEEMLLLPKTFSAGTRCLFESHEMPSMMFGEDHASDEMFRNRSSGGDADHPPELPAWLDKSLARLDDQDSSEEQIETTYVSSLDAGASSSSCGRWRRTTAEQIESYTERQQQQQRAESDVTSSSFDREETMSEEEKAGLEDKLQSEIRRVLEQQAAAAAEPKDEAAEGNRQPGPGWLWKMSLCASVSFVTWVLVNGARIQCRSLFPTIREREQPVKLVRRRKSRYYDAEET